MRHGEVCKKELWGKIPHLEDHFYRLQIGGDAFSGLGIQWVHLSAGDRIGGSKGASVAGLATYFSLTNRFYDFQVGAGLHIVAAVTESCVTGLNDCDNALQW